MDLGVVLWKETHAPTAAELRARMQDDGFNVMEWTDSGGTRYEPHSHDHHAAICPYQGSIEFLINGRSYDLNPGDTLFLPKGTVHAARVPNNSSVSYYIGQPR